MHETQLDTLQIKLSTTCVHRLRIFMLLCSAAHTEWLLSHSMLSVSFDLSALSLFANVFIAHTQHLSSFSLSCVDVMIYSHIIYGKLHIVFLARTHHSIHPSDYPASRHKPTCTNMYQCALRLSDSLISSYEKVKNEIAKWMRSITRIVLVFGFASVSNSSCFRFGSIYYLLKFFLHLSILVVQI